MYLCSYMHIMSISWSIAEAVSSGSWPILFEVLTLNVAVYIVFLNFSNFCFSLCSVADFSNIGAWFQPQLDAPPPFFLPVPLFYQHKKRCGLEKWFEYESWWSSDTRVFVLINRSYPNRWAAVVPRSNYLILAVGPWDSYAQHLVRHGVDPSLGLSAFTPTMLLSMAFKKSFPFLPELIWFVCWVLWHINLCRLFNAKFNFM